jgi:hypothetical protein
MPPITEALIDIHGYGLLSARPASRADLVGRQYFATDNLTLYEDNGTTWDTLFTVGTSGIIAEEVDGTPTGTITKIKFPNGTISIASGVATYTPTGAALTVEEVDGSPTDSAVTKIKFPNGTLSISGHEATYTPTAAAITIQEEDGTPTGSLTTLKVPSGSLVDNGGGSFSIRDVPAGFIGCSLYHTTTQSIPNSTDSKLLYDSEFFDTDGFHSTVSNTSRVTIPAGLAGKYLLTGRVTWAGNSTNSRWIRFMKNGSDNGIFGQGTVIYPGHANTFAMMATAMVDLVAGDYVEVNVFQNSGGSLNAGSTNNYEYNGFSAVKLDGGKVGSGIGALVYPTGTQSINNGTGTAINYGAEVFDTDGFHDNSTNPSRLTVPTGLGGLYVLTANVNWTPNTNGERLISFYKNGSELAAWDRDAPGTGSGLGRNIAAIAQLAAGDYVQVVCYQTSGGALNVSYEAAAPTRNSFAIARLDSGSGAAAQGTAFPSGPVDDQPFYRTDHDRMYRYNSSASKWLSEQSFEMPLPQVDNLAATQQNVLRIRSPWLHGGSDIWLESATLAYHVAGGTALSGSHKWVVDVNKLAVGGSITTFATTSIDSGASNAWLEAATMTINALQNNGTIHIIWLLSHTKTGTPGNLYAYTTVSYRIVAT